MAGASTEISSLAVVVSAFFWTWLWGGVGLVLAAQMLAQVLAESGIATTVLSSKFLASEEVRQAVALAPRIVCISAIHPASGIAARSLCKRLRTQLPSTRIIVGLWKAEDAGFAIRRERLGKVGADATYPDLRKCATDIAEFAACTPPVETADPVAK